MFEKIQILFDKNKPHRELLKEYSNLNKISTELKLLSQSLKTRLDDLIKHGIQKKGEGEATGELMTEKTEFISAELIPSLEKLEKRVEERFYHISNEIEAVEPISPEEVEEIENILKFLNNLKSILNGSHQIETKETNKEKIELIYVFLRNIQKLSGEFIDTQKYEKNLMRRIEKNEISSLLKKIYLEPKILENSEGTLFYPISETQLRELEQESENINACKDQNYQIKWRKFWTKQQVPEIDKNTPIKNAHVNVMIKLFGEPFKNIHLVIA